MKPWTRTAQTSRVAWVAAVVALVATLWNGPARAAAPPAPDALSENSAAQWVAFADLATASVSNSTLRFQVGAYSLAFTTSGGFDTWLRTPPAQNASWDLSSSGGVSFQVYAVNTNFGFQNGSPWVRFYSSAGNYLELRSTADILNDARDQWITLQVPFAGSGTWTRTVVGAPNLADIDWMEIHADTWGGGFDLWIDELRFDLPLSPPQEVRAFVGNHQVTLNWHAYQPTGGTFDHYAIYRQTSPFTDVTGMTPQQNLPGIGTTSWIDTSALNGVSYHYAVTAVFAGGGETRQVQSVGPRTPFNETDLQVVSIARTPRYPRYSPTYTNYEVTEPSGFGPYVFSAATGLAGGQTGATQRWPLVGSPVTWTATVRNRGTNSWSGMLPATWRVDGALVGSPAQMVTLAPNQTATFAITRTWDDLLHTIDFEIGVVDSRDANDRLQTQTKSVAFLSYIDRTRLEAFREETPSYAGAATDDFIDWLNRHMLRFNGMFAAAGTSKRVHFDVLEVLDDVAPDPAIDTTPYAIFPFRYRASEGTLRLSGYYDPSEDLDYGLNHEMGHQLGLIDLYRLDVGPASNQVSALGYNGPACLMNGCSHFISTSSRDAMTQWLARAHGYFGQYLYAIPTQVRMRFLGRDGQPLAGAAVTVYQKVERPGQGEVITTQPKAQGVTDVAGIYVLPNVNINAALVPPSLAGDTLRANPFGYVAVVGTNGVLHFKVEHQEAVDYAWLDVTETNDAYHAGQTAQATFTRQLALGGPIQLSPPADMAELNQSSWTRWAADGAINLYDDTAFKRVGAGSVRIEATGGFDNYWRYPGDQVARWNLANADTLHMWIYAVNPSPFGFQNASPWVFLRSTNGFIELHANYDFLNDARGQWIELRIPLDGDGTWTRTESGTPDLTKINALEIHADTWDAGFTVWMDGVRFSPQPTSGVGEGPAPPEFRVAAAQPNPFSASTTLRFDLPRTTPVTVQVFDAAGRRVRNVVDLNYPAGRHEVAWDGRDERGLEVASGVYFLRLEAIGAPVVRKVLRRR